jgi:hypothetical protein
MAMLVVASAFQPGRPHLPTNRYSDILLYRHIVSRVSQGENYYAVAGAEQRAHGYPTSPAPAFREPTEALLLAALQTDPVRQAALLVLAAGAAVAIWFALGKTGLSPTTRAASVILMLAGMEICVASYTAYIHECWTGLLIVLALALRRPDRWALSVCAGLAACLFRETALPFLFVMAAFAAYERCFRESLVWLGAIALFCGLYAIHCGLTVPQHQPGDPLNRSWLAFGGIDFVIATLRWNEAYMIAPSWVVMGLLCASAVGLSGLRSALASRAALTLIGYAVAFTVVGRSDNSYWGILYAPLAPFGIAFAPAALKDLVTRAMARTTLAEPSGARQPATA